MRILLVDDEVPIQLVIGDYLSIKQHDVVIATTAQEAQQLLSEGLFQYDLIITDLNLEDFVIREAA